MTTPDDAAPIGNAAPSWQQRLASCVKETEAWLAPQLRELPEDRHA